MTMLLMAAVLAATQDTYKLEVRAQKGDAFTHTQTETNQGTIKISLAGKTQTQEVNDREVRKHRDEVLDVDGASPVRVRRQVVEWWKERKDEARGTVDKETRRLQGKTIVLKKKGEATEVEGAEGIPAAELAKNRLRAEPLLHSLPAQPVPVGQEWTIDEKAFKDDLEAEGDANPFAFSTVKAAGKFEKVEVFKGQRCAVLAVTFEAEGRLKKQEKLTIKYALKTTVRLSLETGRMLTSRGEGTSTLAGEADQDGQPLAITGTFTLSAESENVYE